MSLLRTSVAGVAKLFAAGRRQNATRTAAAVEPRAYTPVYTRNWPWAR